MVARSVWLNAVEDCRAANTAKFRNDCDVDDYSAANLRMRGKGQVKLKKFPR